MSSLNNTTGTENRPQYEHTRVHSLKTLAYLAWVGWPRPQEQKVDTSIHNCSCGFIINGFHTNKPHFRVRNTMITSSLNTITDSVNRSEYGQTNGHTTDSVTRSEYEHTYVHSLKTLAYLAWVGWPRPRDPRDCDCGCIVDGKRMAKPHFRARKLSQMRYPYQS